MERRLLLLYIFWLQELYDIYKIKIKKRLMIAATDLEALVLRKASQTPIPSWKHFDFKKEILLDVCCSRPTYSVYIVQCPVAFDCLCFTG